LWGFDAGQEQWTRLEVRNPPPLAGLLEYAVEEDLLIGFGGGRDGVKDDGQQISPAFSRQIWTCRLAGDGRSAAPAAPQRLQIETTPASVTVRWSHAGPHDVLRAPVDSAGLPGRYSPKASGVRPAFTDTDVAAGDIYAYQVVGPNGVPSLPGFSQPFRPSRLRASVDSPTRVTLRWQADDAPDIIGYHVYRADGPELEQALGHRLTDRPTDRTMFVDDAVELSDGLIRSYWVTAVNRLGVESGPSPLAYTVPDAPEFFSFLDGLAPSNGVGVKLRWLISWQWPEDQTIAGFNIYHAGRHVNARSCPGGFEGFENLWTRLNAEPIKQTEFVFDIPIDGPPHHYFHVRAVNTLGQEGFCTDILSPTDRQFRP
jgi:hypothetical protein